MEDDSLSLYQSERLGHSLLDPATEARLLRRASRGDQAAIDALVDGNQRLVMSVARRYFHAGMTGDLDLMDLVQYGNLGLLDAIARFDNERGLRFSTYAVHWIRAYIRRFGLMHGHASPRTAREGDLVARISSARIRLYNQLRRNPTAGEIASLTGLSIRLVERIIPMIPAAVSLDQPAGLDDHTVGDYILAEDDTAESAEQQITLECMRRRLADLPPLYARVLTLRFGLEGAGPLTHAAIAGQLGISKTRVQVIERRALVRLRRALGEDS